MAPAGSGTTGLYQELLERELTRIENEIGPVRYGKGHFVRAAELFTELSRARQCAEFLTLPAYELID